MKSVAILQWVSAWQKMGIIAIMVAASTGCVSSGHYYHAKVDSPEKAAMVAGTNYSLFFHQQWLSLSKVDGRMTPPGFRWCWSPKRVDAGPRLLGVEYLSRGRFASVEIPANLIGGHHYQLCSTETNRLVTIWLSDVTAKTDVTEGVTLLVEPPSGRGTDGKGSDVGWLIVSAVVIYPPSIFLLGPGSYHIQR